MPCLTHDIATAHHHDYVWTAKWAQNTCTLSMPMSLMRLRYGHREHGWRGHLYGTNGTWKNYPTWCTLLDVGFMIILRRADGFVLTWACSAVLTEPTTVIFQLTSYTVKVLFCQPFIFPLLHFFKILRSNQLLMSNSWNCCFGSFRLSFEVYCFIFATWCGADGEPWCEKWPCQLSMLQP